MRHTSAVLVAAALLVASCATETSGPAAPGAASSSSSLATPSSTTPVPVRSTTAAAPTSAALPDRIDPTTAPLALVASGSAVAAIAPGHSPLWSYPDARVALDGTAVALHRFDGTMTEVVAYDIATGDRLGRWQIAGKHRASVVSSKATRVALVDDTDKPNTVTIISENAAATRTVTFKGHVEPEAFSLDAGVLFVLAYIEDSKYRVQTIDVATGDRWDTNDRLKGNLAEDMGGIPVRAVLNGDLLSTLYRDPTSHHHPAFVHTLNLRAGWSHCADLPAPFGLGATPDTMALTADGRTLYVGAADGAHFATIDVDAVRRPSQGEDDEVAIAISKAPPAPADFFSPGGMAWTAEGPVTVAAGAVRLGTRTTPVGEDARLLAVRA